MKVTKPYLMKNLHSRQKKFFSNYTNWKQGTKCLKSPYFQTLFKASKIESLMFADEANLSLKQLYLRMHAQQGIYKPFEINTAFRLFF